MQKEYAVLHLIQYMFHSSQLKDSSIQSWLHIKASEMRCSEQQNVQVRLPDAAAVFLMTLVLIQVGPYWLAGVGLCVLHEMQICMVLRTC